MMFYWLAVDLLCVWRISHLLTAEDGPWDLFAQLRRWAGMGFFGKVLDCFYCLSLWVSAPFSLLVGQTWKERFLLWPALSAGAILIERLTAGNGASGHTVARYTEDSENTDVLLREDEGTVPGRGHASSGK